MNDSLTRRFFLPSLATAPLAASVGVPGSPSTGMARTPAGYIDSRKVLLWEITRKEFREALEGGIIKAAIVPTGSSEQHQEHLAMIHDSASVTLVAQQAALQLYPQTVVATPVSIGISPHWMQYKGTLTLKKETFLAVVFEVCESLKIHGVKNILILNGHGGNVAPLKEAVAGFRDKLGVNVAFNSYWDAYSPETVKKFMASGRLPGHAGEFETSFAMAAFPERIHWENIPEKEKYDEALLATTAKGEALIGMAVDWVANRVKQMIAG